MESLGAALMSDQALVALQLRLGYTFEDAARLRQALTHRSIKKQNNERLEFLGDAVLAYVITEQLYQRFSDASEGELSHLRSVLVSRKTLAAVSRELDVGSCLQLGVSEKKSGVNDRDSILSDALEALIGGIYLDAGVSTCRECILRWYQGRLDDPKLRDTQKDAKSQLQEQCQAMQFPLPVYSLERTDGAAHALRFTVRCELPDQDVAAVCEADTRREAEQGAAKACLMELNHG